MLGILAVVFEVAQILCVETFAETIPLVDVRGVLARGYSVDIKVNLRLQFSRRNEHLRFQRRFLYEAVTAFLVRRTVGNQKRKAELNRMEETTP